MNVCTARTHPWDHPRSRGVYAVRHRRRRANWGSSPLARGLLDALFSFDTSSRIIPARAGFTKCTDSASSHVRDHPRSRGVYPPRRPERPVRTGIIPARAGFTASQECCRWAYTDHPRSRGVYLIRSIIDLFVPGSSPLARGLHGFGFDDAYAGGIIPARAGFTRCRMVSHIS